MHKWAKIAYTQNKDIKQPVDNPAEKVIRKLINKHRWNINIVKKKTLFCIIIFSTKQNISNLAH
jgi:hypothetical protein